MIKWLIIILLSIQICGQTKLPSSRQNYELEKLMQTFKDTKKIKFTAKDFVTKYSIYIAFMLALPLNAQIVITSGDSYGSNLDRTPPSVPSNLHIVAISDDSLLAYWTNPPEADFNRNVVWFWGAVKDSTSNDSIYFTSLKPNTTYGFRVLAVDDSSNRSAYSDSITATTLDTTTSGGSLPAAPTNLIVTDSLDALTLQWTANPPNATFFDIQRDDVDYDTVAFAGESVLVTWNETATVDGVYHEYKVKARNATGSSAYCDSVIAERYTSNTYYVSSGGSNSNSGTNPNLAWATLSKVNASWLEGKNVYFKKGETFNGNLTIQNNNVTLASYGEGLKPVITLYEAIPGWATASNWSLYTTNVYRMAINPDSKQIWRLWLNGTEAELEASRGNVDSAGEFFHAGWDGYLYIYSATKPSSAFTSIEYSGGIRTGGDIYQTVSLKNANYAKLDGLDIQGGLYATLGISGSSYDTIRNCNIGKNSQMYAVRGNNIYWDYSSESSDYNVFYNDTLDNNWARSHYDEANASDGGDGTYGIAMEHNASSWDIYDNYVANFWFPFQIISSYDGESRYHKIHDNEITNTVNLTMGYPLTLLGIKAINNGFTNIEYYNNYCHNIYSFVEIFASGNKIYYNIFKDFRKGTAQYQSSDHGLALYMATDNYNYGGNIAGVDSNYIFNNTIDSTYRAAYNSDNDVYQWFYNNLILDANYYGDYSNNCAIEVSFWERGKHKNNLFYKTGSTSSTLFIDQTGLNEQTFTVDEWNAYASGRTGKEQSGNIFPTGKTKQQIMLPDFTIPTGSPALNAGIDIDALLSDGFKDRNGNTVNQTAPNIGAIDN